MLPFTIAVFATFCWALVNVIDKFLVSRFCKNNSIGSLLILSSIFPVTLIPLGYIMSSHSERLISNLDVSILIFSGFLITCWMYFYFSALLDEDVSTVMPLFQLTPIFVLIFSFFILKEFPDNLQLFYSVLIVIGALILSYEQSSGRIKLKLIAQLSAASAIIALINTLFKFVALDSSFWVSIIWQSVGVTFTGLMIFILNKKYRSEFVIFVKSNLGIGLMLNGLNETLVLVGNLLFAYATLLAPIALIQTMGAYQPVFVLMISVVCIYLFSIEGIDRIDNTTFKQKVLGITFILIGSIYLSISIL